MALIEIKEPSRRDLRQFAALWVPAIATVAGALVLLRSGAIAPAISIWAAAAGFGAAGYLFPAFVRPVYLGLMYASYPIGWTVSMLALAVIYYLIMTPLGLVARLFGRDALQQEVDRSAKTYWISHHPDADPARYFRQF